MSTFVIGDIHGELGALKECLSRAAFDYENDTLISLGDLVDRGNDSYLVIEELLKIKNKILIRGNHDEVFNHWIKTGHHRFDWAHGSMETKVSYMRAISYDDDFDSIDRMDFILVPESHRDLFDSQVSYYIDDKKRLFVHAGINREYTIAVQTDKVFLWDRDFWKKAMSCKSDQMLKTVDGFSEIYIGHTATTNWSSNEIKTESGIILSVESPITYPMYSGGVWNIDTGSGYDGGKLSIKNIETGEIFQSDLIKK